MRRVVAGVVLALAVGWFMFGRGDDAAAVTDCLTDAGATVEESLRFAQLFPYAIAVRTLDRVEEYPELEGARFYSVSYGVAARSSSSARATRRRRPSKARWSTSWAAKARRCRRGGRARRCWSGSERRTRPNPRRLLRVATRVGASARRRPRARADSSGARARRAGRPARERCCRAAGSFRLRARPEL